MALPELKLPYYDRDYAAIKAALISVIKSTPALKGVWTDFSENDFGMILLELFCGVADMTSFNLDNQAAEVFLDTSRKRRNVARIASSLGYSMMPKTAGIVDVSVVITQALDHNYNILAGTQFKAPGAVPKIFTVKENFILPSTALENRCCKFSIVATSGSAAVTDVALTGVNIANFTSVGVIYVKHRNEGGKNKIALYRNSARTGALDNTTTDPDKIAYGEVNSGTYIIPITEVNGSGLAGNIYIGVANFSGTVSVVEEFHIVGPTCYEGQDITETFTSNGLPNQRFDTQYAIQRLPSSSTKTKSLSVNAVPWTEVEDMFFDQQNYFTVETIEHEYSTIVFGDGQSGNIPPNGATISVVYINGTGASGYVGSGKITGIITTLLDSGTPVATQQVNIEETVDAADDESISVTKTRAIEVYKTRGRAVHEEDYEALLKLYAEDGMYNPTLVQCIKNDTEPDLINEVEIFVLSTDPETGRYRLVDIDLTTSGGMWAYIQDLKTIPEGIRKSSDGSDGFQNGTLDSTTADFYYNIFKISGYDREVIREAVREAVITYYHALDFQSPVKLFSLSKAILSIEGIQSVQIFTDSGHTTPAADVDISTYSDRGKVLVLPTAFYTVGEAVYVAIEGD